MNEEEFLLQYEDEVVEDELLDYHYVDGITSQWRQCSEGVLHSLRSVLAALLLAACLKRFLAYLHSTGLVSQSILHLSIVCSGLYIIGTQNEFMPHICTYIALVAILPCCKFFVTKHFGFIMLLYSISLLLVWQYVFAAEEFMSMRGVLMIVLMKITSLSFDLANEQHACVPLFHLCSYLLDGSTVIFGPWITYKQYQESLHWKNYKVEVIDAFRALLLVIISLLFVIYSSCITESYTEWPYFGAFFVAQSFRFSHYFVSWLSAGTSLLSGVDTGVVAEWIHIEWPRSLVDVVVSWNIPMHMYLHRYVFAEVRKYGSAVAIFITYAVSSLLHGINFQLSSVLLSLGLYTYAETRLRSRLSRHMNSCVRARKCNECHHRWKEVSVLFRKCFKEVGGLLGEKENSLQRKLTSSTFHQDAQVLPIYFQNAFSTIAVNMAFRVLAIIHLIYLGMVFDGSAAIIGYSWTHTFTIWGGSYFYSHIIGLFTLLLSFFV